MSVGPTLFRIIASLFLIFPNSVIIGISPCGEVSYGNCFSNCYGNCLESTKSETEENKKEYAVMEKNLCDGKCRGEIYASQLEPEEKDYSQCVGPCSIPIPGDCQNGYISLYFYCDCVACCTNLGSSKAQKCIDGCHQHFGKPDEDLGTSACSYRPEYNQSVNLWCSAWCTWKLIKKDNLPATAIQDTMTKSHSSCVPKCVSSIRAGKIIDYKSKVAEDITAPAPIEEKKCGEGDWLYSCINWIVKRVAIKSNLENNQIKDAPRTNKSFKALTKILNSATRSKLFLDFVPGEYELLSISVTWPSALKDIREKSMAKIKFANDVAVDLPATQQTRSEWVPWQDFNSLFASAFRQTYDRATVYGKTRINASVSVAPCTIFQGDHLLQFAKFPNLVFEIFVSVSDSRKPPLAAAELRKAILNKAEWNGLEYVRDVNKNEIELKAHGSWEANIVVDAHLRVKRCEKISNCEHNPDWSKNNACVGFGMAIHPNFT